MSIKSVFTKVLDLIEGPANTIYLDRDPVLLEKIKDAVARYSKLPPESTGWWNGVGSGGGGSFNRFETELWPKTEEDLELFMLVLKRALDVYFCQRGEKLSIIIIPDKSGPGSFNINGYYAHKRGQARALARWYMRLTVSERKRALETLEVKDPMLQAEIAEVRKIDERILKRELQSHEKSTESGGRKDKFEIRIGFWREEGIDRPLPLYIPLQVCPHILISGKSGSGKGVLLLYMLNSVLNYKEINLYIGDPKNSGDFGGITPHYATNENVADLVEEVYKKYQEIKQKKTGERLLLIVDEYPSFILDLESRDKKRSGAIKNMIAELLMQGRDLCGGSVMLWLVAQRADADYFPKGARLNFMVAIGLGRLDMQSKTMLFPGEDLPEYEPTRGTGLILMDGKPLRVFEIPEIDGEELKKLLKEKARRRSGGHADPEPGGAST